MLHFIVQLFYFILSGMPSTLITHPGHILAAGDAKSADPDKFGPKNTLILPSGQIFKSRGWVRSNPDENDQMTSGQKPPFSGSGLRRYNGGPTIIPTV